MKKRKDKNRKIGIYFSASDFMIWFVNRGRERDDNNSSVRKSNRIGIFETGFREKYRIE